MIANRRHLTLERSRLTTAVLHLLILIAFTVKAESANKYTQAMFRRAMAKDNIAVSGELSSAPLYVLIRLVDARTGRSQAVCTLSTALQGAIAYENHLDVVKDGRKIYGIAISAPGRTFRFTNYVAREKVTPPYTEQQLTEIRRSIQGKSHEQLRKEANVDLLRPPNQQSAITKLYRREIGKRFWSSVSYRVAVAHVLLERGLPVGEAEDSQVLYIDNESVR
jgi:hypothetical protein